MSVWDVLTQEINNYLQQNKCSPLSQPLSLPLCVCVPGLPIVFWVAVFWPEAWQIMQCGSIAAATSVSVLPLSDKPPTAAIITIDLMRSAWCLSLSVKQLTNWSLTAVYDEWRSMINFYFGRNLFKHEQQCKTTRNHAVDKDIFITCCNM